jgi:hypothetical protein
MESVKSKKFRINFLEYIPAPIVSYQSRINFDDYCNDDDRFW